MKMPSPVGHVYAIGLGSNRRHGRYGSPGQVLDGAIAALDRAGIHPLLVSPVIATRPVGPGGRAYANAAALVATAMEPRALLLVLKAIERAFGRRRGQRWGARVLDLDILLWSGGAWTSGGECHLRIPHRQLSRRRFVLDPLVVIAPGWRLPDGRTVRQHHVRLTRAKPIHRTRDRSGP